jgi:hypothetical protein
VSTCRWRCERIGRDEAAHGFLGRFLKAIFPLTNPHTKSEDQPRPQHERFVETARQLECDEDKERFEAKLKKIATAKSKATKRTAAPGGSG